VGQRARWLKSAANTMISEKIISENKQDVRWELYGENDLSNSYLKNKILFASTTNFGLSLPFQHPHRRKTAMKYGLSAYKASESAMKIALKEFNDKIRDWDLEDKNVLFIQPILNRGTSEREKVNISAPLLIRYNLNKDLFEQLKENANHIRLVNPNSPAEIISYKIEMKEDEDSYNLEAILPPSFFKTTGNKIPFLFIEGVEELQTNQGNNNLIANKKLIKNKEIQVEINEKGFISKFQMNGTDFACPNFLEPAASYGPMGKATRYSPKDQKVEVLNDGSDGFSASVQFSSEFKVINDKTSKQKLVLTLYNDLPYLFVEVTMDIPEIKGEATSEDGVEFVKETFNEKWKEIMPCEIKPRIFGKDTNLRVWKKNFFGVVDYFDLNMKSVDEENADIDCFVSNLSDGWMGLSNHNKGLVIGFNALKAANFAFAPIKIRDKGFQDCGKSYQQIRINPFGTYFGRSLHYWTDGNEHAQKLLPKMMRQKKSTAATFSGKTISFEIVICPYEGDKPPAQVQSLVNNYSLPPLLLLKSKNRDSLYHNFKAYNQHAESLIDQFDIEELMDMSYLEWVRRVNKNYDPSQPSQIPKTSMKLGLRCLITLLIDGIRGR